MLSSRNSLCRLFFSSAIPQSKVAVANSAKGFLRTGTGFTIDSLDEYVDPVIVDDKQRQQMEEVTTLFLTSFVEKDTKSIEGIATPKLAQKSIEWIGMMEKNKDQLIFAGASQRKDHLNSTSQVVKASFSLQCFTNFSYMYGIDHGTTKGFKEFRSYDFNKNFLVKRIIFLDGFKLNRLFSKKSQVAEAIVYSSQRIVRAKELSDRSLNSGGYHGFKIQFVNSNLKSNENDHQNPWKIADINDWVQSDLQVQNFTKWAFNALGKIDQE